MYQTICEFLYNVFEYFRASKGHFWVYECVSIITCVLHFGRQTQAVTEPDKSELTNRFFHITMNIYKAKAITPSIAWRREAWKDEELDDLP